MTTRLIDPHDKPPTLNELWNSPSACKRGRDTRICPAPNGGWVVIVNHGGMLGQSENIYDSFKAALQATISIDEVA